MIGVDFAPQMIIQASKLYSNPLFVSGAFPAFPFKANSFDFIFATEVLYYVSDTDRKKTWDQIRKILKPGGRVFFTSLLDDGSRYFTAKSALDMAAETMKIEQVFYDYNFLFNLISRQVTKIVRVTECITGKSSMSHNRRRIVGKLVGILEIPIIGEVLTAGLKVMEFFAKSFLCLQHAPETLSKVSKRTLGDKARTHIAFIARKNTRLKSREAKVS